jgi:RES domain-containing protein
MSTAADLVSDRPNRWNVEGEPTIYLSGDRALALVEAGRHKDDVQPRSVVIRVELDLARSVDLRMRPVREALQLPDDLDWILDKARTRRVAQLVRSAGPCQGLIVPSAGALDQPERWNLVLFADHREIVDRVVGSPQLDGWVVMGGPATRVDVATPHPSISSKP